jgi:Rrf2 family protein
MRQLAPGMLEPRKEASDPASFRFGVPSGAARLVIDVSGVTCAPKLRPAPIDPDLGSVSPGKPVQAHEIAKANNIPKKFLDAFLGELRNAGIVYSKKGPGGGYVLARAPEDIQIGHVVRTLDGPFAPIAYASRTAFHQCDDCKDVRTCAVRLVMTKVRDAMAEVLYQMSIADMLRDARQAESRPPVRHLRKASGRGALASGRR